MTFAKVSFRGRVYPLNIVVQAVCKAFDDQRYDEAIEDEEDAYVAIHMIVKGDPTRCAAFIQALNEGSVR